ncbi:Uncharacterized protein TCAP_04995 [Tolypocladium capitatum]|uniref:Uncharacterized protein n=1 Tax=Tolypocladium capitatum TaxID=45235 RepID=A0A2K3QBZ2_9HYPO|nr:Uncharacterized protein TCAP_04995 [Tolypocladium capitatum]
MTEARLQSAYDGAALVYARNQALSYLGKSDPPGHAEITTFTTDGTNLNLYAHYAARSDDGTFEYHQYPIASASLLKYRQEHNEGRRGLRNEQDHVRKQSCDLRDQLKEHWKQRRGGIQPIAEAAPPVADGTFEETNGDEDEDEASYEVVEQPCESTPAVSSQSFRASSSVSSSLPPTNDSVPSSGGQKRKASSPSASSRGSSGQKSKGKSYWQRDASGRLFHKHSDGRIRWAKEDDRY